MAAHSEEGAAEAGAEEAEAAAAEAPVSARWQRAMLSSARSPWPTTFCEGTERLEVARRWKSTGTAPSSTIRSHTLRAIRVNISSEATARSTSPRTLEERSV